MLELYLCRIWKAEEENLPRKEQEHLQNSHWCTGVARAWQSSGGALPTEGTFAGFSLWGLLKSPHHHLPQTVHKEFLLQLRSTEQSPPAILTTQCTRMLRGIQNSKEKTSTEPTMLSARNFPVNRFKPISNLPSAASCLHTSLCSAATAKFVR